MNEGISVRTCNEKDVDTLVTLGIKTFRDTFDDFNTPDNMMRYINKTFTKKAVQEEMRQPGTVYFLALDGRQPAGYAKMRVSENPQELGKVAAMEIERLYAHNQYIGKRVGYMLLKACEDFAKKKRSGAVWLGVWENNARAIAFYEKNGFKRFGQHTFMLGEDPQTDLLMRKDLGQA